MGARPISDVQSRCMADLRLAGETRAEADAIESAVESRRNEPGIQPLYAQLVELNRSLAHRARTLQTRADESEGSDLWEEDIELEMVLTAYLAHKVRHAGRLLENELGRPRVVCVPEEEEPLR